VSRESSLSLESVARAFTMLEADRSRHRLVDLAAELLSRARPDERAPLVYLLQGQLRPPYEGVELGVGEQLLIGTIASAYEATTAEVSRRFKSLGDLGLVAEALAPATVRRRLTLLQAYRALLEVARTAGPGSVRGKTARLATLLHSASPLEARVLVRIAQGRLRLGVGDQTILEATAAGALGDRRRKALVEGAYNVRSDLGGVVRLAYAKGVRGLEAITPEIGVPVRPALAQRLPSAEAIIGRLGTVQAEPKYDGFRLQVHRDGDRVWAFSRRLENVTGMFPELTEGIRRQLKGTRVIIEGEAVVHDPRTGEFLPFQVTMTRKRKKHIPETSARHPLRLFAFDLLYSGHRSWLARPQRERSAELRRLIRFSPKDPIVVTETMVTDQVRDLERYFERMIGHGLEGVVAKRLDAPYRAGARGYDWVKLKRAYQSGMRDTVDLVLVGYLRGRGKRAALGIGSLLAAVYDPPHDRFRTVAKIGSGLSEQAWTELRSRLDERIARSRPARVESLIAPDVWVEPAIVVEVLADEITRSPSHTCGRTGNQPGYALRFPRMLGVREDKAATDATSEREILGLYRQQAARGRSRGPAGTATTRRQSAEG
jgi:DNA ligase-1